MTEQEERFIHFSCCVAWLNNAWRLLNVIREEAASPLIAPAFRFALVEYSKPYKHSRGVTKSFKLGTEFVPPAMLPLHQRVINSRDQVHAHSDLTLMDAKLSVHEFMGQRYSLIVQNKITGAEELPNLKEVVALIEGTLDNMYSAEKALEAALPMP
jgi:hypothetical protein